MSNFLNCLKATLKWEGGYSDHPSDPGGATMKGVTQGRYDQYRKQKGLGKQPVRFLTIGEMREIYRKYYWNVVKGDSLPAGVDLCVFDYAVNSGPSRSVKHLQEILGVDIDGQLGPETLKSVNAVDPKRLVNLLMDRRQRFVRGLSIYKTFGRGWENRIKDIRKESIAMVSHTGPVYPDDKNIFKVVMDWLSRFF